MQHFPIFMAVAGRRIVLSGGGDAAVSKLRLLMKTEARISVFTPEPAPDIAEWAQDGKLTLIARALEPGDAMCAVLFYAANEDEVEDARGARLAAADGAIVNIVDNLSDSQFITPAIVDRDPVTVAIGTEGAAPVLARAIKRDLVDHLPQNLGRLARIGKGFRSAVNALPMGRKRREFWSEFYFKIGPKALEKNGKSGVLIALKDLLDRHLTRQRDDGHVDFVGAGPGDPELLTLKARKALDAADVVIHDRLVAREILELARREATIIDVGKEGFGPSTSQETINAIIVEHALGGAHVVRLKSGDPTIFGRLDEETEVCRAAGIAYTVVPGITAVSAAVAGLGQSLTRRARNSALQFLTGHDTKGFTDHDWKRVAHEGEVAAIYMGKRAARFIQGRLLMHGAHPQTPVTMIENASRSDERILRCTLSGLSDALKRAELTGPAIMIYGLPPLQAASAIQSYPLKGTL